MQADADLATVAELMSGHRATLLLMLLGGTPLSAGDLARHASISPSLASEHLSRLLDGGLVTVAQRGRRREYRLAGPEIARAIEGLLYVAPGRRPQGLRASTRTRALHHARTCYDHLAGEVGVAITDAMADRDRLRPLPDGGLELTESGERWLDGLGIDVGELRARRRTLTRPCLDWTERRPHLAGALGAAIAGLVLERGWAVRLPGTRALRVTDSGVGGLAGAFGVNAARRPEPA